MKRESPIVLELDKDEEWDDNLNTEALMRPPLDRGPYSWQKRHKVTKNKNELQKHFLPNKKTRPTPGQ